MSASQQLQNKIQAMPIGSVFSASDFFDITSKGNIDVILHRLSNQQMIRFLGYGLYDRPLHSDKLGALSPNLSDVMNAYGRKMNQTFVLDPLNSANMIGLTTQVPAQLTYLTNGKSTTLVVCGIHIHLLHTSPKKMAGSQTSIGPTIQALRYFGRQGAPDHIIQKIAKSLSLDDFTSLSQIKHQTMRHIEKQINRIEHFATLH